MLYDVYILGPKGDDPLPAMLAKPTRGQLLIRKRFPTRSDTILNATLINPSRPDEPLMEMGYVQLIGMTAESMVIEGTVGRSRGQQKSKVEHSKERWLCKVPGTKITVTADTLRRSKMTLTKAMQADPFHPLWDDVADERTYGKLDPSIG